MKINVAINGFGRIGRLVCRAAMQNDAINIVAINDLVHADNLAYLLKYDTVHGTFADPIEARGESIIIAGQEVRCICETDPTLLPWSEMGVDYVVESTGVFTTYNEAIKHVESGARRVVISAPTKSPVQVPTLVVGVNEDRFDPTAHPIVSNASCTTNCLAPIAMIVDQHFGIVEGLMTTVHAATAAQPTQDGPSRKDWRGGRNAYMNIIPATTGAAKAVALALPQLDGKLTGMAFRVPTANVSVVDLTVRTEKVASYDQISEQMRIAAEGPLKGILGYTEEAVVSSDFVSCPLSSVFDKGAGLELNPNFFKLVSWYDNEWGYSNRVVDLMLHMARVEDRSRQQNVVGARS